MSKSEDLNHFYLKNNRLRSFPFPKLFSMMEKLIETSYFPLSIYFILLLIETIQILVLIWTYTDSSNINLLSSTNITEFSKNFSSLSINAGIRDYLTPYSTLLTIFTKEKIEIRTYFILSACHLGYEIIFIILIILLFQKCIKESFIGLIINKIVQYRLILTLHCFFIYEFSLVLIIFKCNDSYNILLNNAQCYQGFYYIASFCFNIFTLILKLLCIYIFSRFYQDFTIFSNKLPWSSPHNQLMFIQNIFKLLLIIAIIFINSPVLALTFKAIGVLLFLFLILFIRLQCPLYFNQSVTYVKIYFEGVIFFFTLMVYGYSILAGHFFTNVTNIDYYYLCGISFFLGGVYVFYVQYYSDQNLLSFIKEMISKDHNVDMYNVYINLSKLELMIMNSKKQMIFTHKLFMIFSCHFEYCNDEKCFCHEVDFMLRNKEVQFQLNQFHESNLVYVQRKDFINYSFSNAKENTTENDNSNANANGKDINKESSNTYIKKAFNNQDEENRNLTTNNEDDAKAKFIQSHNSQQRENTKKSNDRIFWGKFIARLIYGYLSYKQTINGVSCKNKKRYFLSVIPIEETYFELVKIEYANMIMFFLNNPINALIECNLIRFDSSVPVIQFVIYLSMKRIFDQIYKCEEKGISGVEMKNILQYNQLWTNLLLELKKNIINVKKLWINLSKRMFNINQIERNCKKINIKSEEINTLFKDIMLINGHSTSSLDIDYKVFKIYGYYLKKIWKNDDNAEPYIKKAIDEISSANQMINIKTSKFDDGRDMNHINSSYFRLNNTGITIVSGDMTMESFSKITYVNESLWKDLAGYGSSQDLLNKNINILMPDFIGVCHDHYIKNFFLTSQFKVFDTFRSIFIIDKEKMFVPVKLIIKLFPSLSRGINFVGYITRSQFYEGMISKNSKIGYFLTDIKNKILFFDKVVKNKLRLPNIITYNITKLPEDDFFLHSIFPELLNESKLDELKRGSNRLIFNEFALEKYIEKNKEEELTQNVPLLSSLFSFHRGSSDYSMYSIEKKIKQSFKLGLIDKKYMNYDTKYQHSIVSFNKAFNIYYIIFEKDFNEKANSVLEELKNVEAYNNQKEDEDPDIGSISSSSVSYNKGGASTSVNFILTTIKITLSSHRRPIILNIVGSMIIILLIIMIGLNLGEGAFFIVKVHEIKYYIQFIFIFYREHYMLYSLEQKMLMWHYTQLGFVTNPIIASDETYLSREIENMITQLSYIQSNISLLNSHSCLNYLVNSYLEDQVIPYRTFLNDKEYLESKKTRINFELDYVQTIKNILKFTDQEPLKIITNFLIDFNGLNGYDYENKDPASKEFIMNYLSYRYNYEVNYRNYYIDSYNKLIPEGKKLIISIQDFSQWVMTSVIIFLLLFYIGVSIMFYILTLKIYSITTLLVGIPYHFIESCLEDINFLQANFERVIYDDTYFISTNMNTFRSCYVVKSPRGKKKEGEKDISITQKSNNKTQINLQQENPTQRETIRSSERKMLEVQDSMKVINTQETKWLKSDNSSIPKRERQHEAIKETEGTKQEAKGNGSKQVKGPESKNDEKFLKYDPFYQQKQYTHIKFSILRASISLLFFILLLILAALYVCSFFGIKQQIKRMTNGLEVIDTINNIRDNLPTMLHENKLKAIDNTFNYSNVYSDYILYNQTYLSLILSNEKNTSGFYKTIMKYYNTITSFNSTEFCLGWVDTKDIRYTSLEFESNKLFDICILDPYFANGIELGAIRASAAIQQLIFEWNDIQLPILQSDAKRLEIIKDETINTIDISISSYFIPLVNQFMKVFSDYHIESTQAFFYLTIERFIIMMSVTSLVVLFYFFYIQKKYFEHFENNKVLLLLIPLEYLKKNKKELSNYI